MIFPRLFAALARRSSASYNIRDLTWVLLTILETRRSSRLRKPRLEGKLPIASFKMLKAASRARNCLAKPVRLRPP